MLRVKREMKMLSGVVFCIPWRRRRRQVSRSVFRTRRTELLSISKLHCRRCRCLRPKYIKKKTTEPNSTPYDIRGCAFCLPRHRKFHTYKTHAYDSTISTILFGVCWPTAVVYACHSSSPCHAHIRKAVRRKVLPMLLACVFVPQEADEAQNPPVYCCSSCLHELHIFCFLLALDE